MHVPWAWLLPKSFRLYHLSMDDSVGVNGNSEYDQQVAGIRLRVFASKEVDTLLLNVVRGL